jgi:hypothetical protein
MHVPVSDSVGAYVSTAQAGWKLLELIGPALARGEEVVLDFEGVRSCGALFFSASVGVLIEQDSQGRVAPLLRYENLTPLWRDNLESAVYYATRRREDPRWAAALDEAVARWSQRE